MGLLLRLLMVEDSEDDAELIRLELEKVGYELEWRRLDTEEEFKLALQESWDLILSDFQMPTFDGLRAFSIYRDHRIDTPFIFVSGALGEERAVEAMRIGARDYLLKGNLARLSVAVKRELQEAKNREAQRLAEQISQQEQRRLAMAVEASGAGVFEYDMGSQPQIYHSDRWALILGFGSDEIPGFPEFDRWFWDRIHPDDLDKMRQASREFCALQSERYEVECRIRHKDGHWVDVGVFAKSIQREAKNPVTHVVGVMLDLTERRRLEAQLRQAHKMEAVGRLSGGIAHDFNNLLTVIFSFGHFVLDELQPSDSMHQDMQEVLKAARKAEALTSQLLAFSRHKPVSPRVLNINTLVSDIDRMLRRIVGEDVEIMTFLAPNLLNVRIDPGSLEQVILNAAVNARDAMPGGGTLTIETLNEDVAHTSPGSPTSSMPPGCYVVVAITDSGIGMDQATQRRIFEPFFTTKESGRGTGLGLSTCYGIIKQAGGYIGVYSELGKGTSIRLYLPCVCEDIDEIHETHLSEDLQGSETILVAEDDDQVRKLAARALARFGYRVIEAANGPAAIAESDTDPDPIDLLLTDVIMPEMNGVQLAETLGPKRPEMKVLYMSGYTANAMEHLGLAGTGNLVLQKPFTPETLARRIREVLDATAPRVDRARSL